MREEIPMRYEKVWGEELWLVNSKNYCGKLLLIDERAKGSLHYHKIKEETFCVLEGTIRLTVIDTEYTLNSDSNPITIEPGDKHQFEGITPAVILEVSTHHDDEDVVRITESQRGIYRVKSPFSSKMLIVPAIELTWEEYERMKALRGY